MQQNNSTGHVSPSHKIKKKRGVHMVKGTSGVWHVNQCVLGE